MQTVTKRWESFAVLEGCAKFVAALLMRSLSFGAGNLGAAAGFTLWSSVAQAAGGAVVALVRRTSFAIGRRIFWCMAFGVSATTMTMMHVGSLSYPDAEVGSTTFLITLSIVPGVLVDRIFFGDRLAPRQFLGIGLFLLSGWAILNFP